MNKKNLFHPRNHEANEPQREIFLLWQNFLNNALNSVIYSSPPVSTDLEYY